MRPEFDQKDQEILRQRIKIYLTDLSKPRIGHFVRFADGVERRISHIWKPTKEVNTWEIQTSNDGSFYLGNNGYMIFSGSLYRSFPVIKDNQITLRLTSEMKLATIWFFHHNEVQAHNGVYAYTEFPLWECILNAP